MKRWRRLDFPFQRNIVLPRWVWRVWSSTGCYKMPWRLRVFVYRLWTEWRWNQGEEFGDAALTRGKPADDEARLIAGGTEALPE
jgi:hypothetical protein